MENRIQSGKKEKGFILVGTMLFIVFLGIVMAAYSEVWSTVNKREKEAELRFILKEYRTAIERYRMKKMYNPSSIEELYEERYLRKKYKDPFTGRLDWEIEKTDEKIYNVRSSSKEKSMGGEDYSKW